MRRAALALLVLAAAAAPAYAGSDGVYLTLDGGYALWNKDGLSKKLARSISPADVSLLVDKQMPDGGFFGLHLGYNISGHVGIEGSFAIHPWSPFDETRGGAGFMGLALRWFPLQGLLKPSRQFDISLLAGINYMLMGGGGIQVNGVSVDNSGRGFDGIATEFGLSFELYPSKVISLGLTPRIYFLDPARYFTSFNKRNEGGSVALGGGGGGSMFTISFSVSFHFEPIPD
jgi:Outer membrane protein beta-barrel domain